MVGKLKPYIGIKVGVAMAQSNLERSVYKRIIVMKGSVGRQKRNRIGINPALGRDIRPTAVVTPPTLTRSEEEDDK